MERVHRDWTTVPVTINAPFMQATEAKSVLHLVPCLFSCSDLTSVKGQTTDKQIEDASFHAAPRTDCKCNRWRARASVSHTRTSQKAKIPRCAYPTSANTFDRFKRNDESSSGNSEGRKTSSLVKLQKTVSRTITYRKKAKWWTPVWK